MVSSLTVIKKELQELRKDVAFIKNAFREDYELSASAAKALERARSTPQEQYVSQAEMEKEFLR